MNFLNQQKAGKAVMLIVSFVFAGGCASNANGIDPYENLNRPIYQFNNKVDNYVAKPVADAYKHVTPQFMQTGVSNFFNNLQDINVILNDVLQAKFEQSAQDFSRFALNTTLGVFGLVDVAKDAGLDKHNEDFGQTLAVWGVPQGSYLVLPFAGPSTFRELPGYVVDSATNPANYLGISIPVASLGLINTRANAEGSLKFINEAAIDPYVFTREAFMQWRRYESADGKVDTTKDMEDLESELGVDENVGAKGKQEVSKLADLKTEVPHGVNASNSGMSRVDVAESKDLQSKKLSYEDAKRAFMEADAKLKSLKINH